MVKKLCGLLLAAMLLALLAACGADAGQPTGDIAAAMGKSTSRRGAGKNKTRDRHSCRSLQLP